MVMLLLFSACSGRKMDLGNAITERDSLPVLDTRGVTTLISDSGIIRYRINTAQWLVFDRKTPSFWAFEKGIYLEKFDSLFHIESNIKADTAYYYDKEELWKLMSNVHIQNVQGEKFDTDLLYWDQRRERVYSDERIRIEQPDRVIFAVGFESNQQMTNYTLHRVEGTFYFDEEETAAPAPPEETDSLGMATDSLGGQGAPVSTRPGMGHALSQKAAPVSQKLVTPDTVFRRRAMQDTVARSTVPLDTLTQGVPPAAGQAPVSEEEETSQASASEEETAVQAESSSTEAPAPATGEEEPVE